MNTKKRVGITIAIITLVAMTLLGREGYREAVAYEEATAMMAQQMSAEGIAELKLKELASLFTLGIVENDTKEKLLLLEKEREVRKGGAEMIAFCFGLSAFVLLLLYFLLPLRGFTITISLGAFVALINGLVAPIMLVIVHKEVEYFGDVVLSFESKGILGSIAKLYATGSATVAVVILVFSVLIPGLKTIAMLFVSYYEYSPFASKVVHLFKHLGKWSMIDVFVVALLLVYLTSGSSDVSRAEPEIGLYFFLTYVLLSMVASLGADKMLQEMKSTKN